ncbi:hypothetical protein AA347_01240 [Aliarcobacter thereius LMG 24486]|uniref:Uncharacterized protein n=1 Tax=Aliarcobacter thereius LMG 24486 TaxID=1032240 RepID=A0A1C7WPS5_9BACT|nr:hypothetical protein AAX27_01227 [Aliarcobacter thereius]OCL95760.1 hypothetical protein AA347_01240 [Aliarcobacter thereius LMG 24486]
MNEEIFTLKEMIGVLFTKKVMFFEKYKII